jgi:hypothetical protein
MHVNVICMLLNVLLAGSGCGGEGRARGTKAVDFKQKNLRGREIRHHGQGTAFQVSVFSFLFLSLIRTHRLMIDCMCKIKKEVSVQVKNKSRVGTQNMRLFLVHQSSW